MFKNIFGRKKEFNFTEPENTVCVVCNHIIHDNSPIMYIAHNGEGDGWEFYCGAEHHETTDVKLISLGQIVDIDSRVNKFSDMPEGIYVQRETENDEWVPCKISS